MEAWRFPELRIRRFMCFTSRCVITTGLLLLAAFASAGDVPPPTVALDGKALQRARARAAPESLAVLRKKADPWLAQSPVAVTDKKVAAPSGNPHDYVSLARYWWPNPATANGLPYVRRDGEPNPENAAYDRPRFERMAQMVEETSLAWFFTGDSRYAEAAARQLRTWFLDDATRMTPHLKHAQLIKGVNDGRGIGLIDVRRLVAVMDAEALLRSAPSCWAAADHDRLVDWFRDYFHWLTTSEHGRQEAAERNNHGTWFDVQAASIALFIGDTASARRICGQAGPRRIAIQVEPDGRLPLELSRTLSLFYVIFNIEGMFRLARLGEEVGVDLWQYRTPDGRSLRAALDWVLPYATGQKAWKHPQISAPDFRPLASLLRQASSIYQEPTYEAAVGELPGLGDELLWVNLLHPRF